MTKEPCMNEMQISDAYHLLDTNADQLGPLCLPHLARWCSELLYCLYDTINVACIVL